MTTDEMKILAGIGAGIVGWLLRLEHRLTKSESEAKQARENTEYLRNRFDTVFGPGPLVKK